MRVLLGAQLYPVSGEAAGRFARAVDSWRALPDTALVNVQFPDDVTEVDGLETLPVLSGDSVNVTGRRGGRKPITLEVFSVLASAAGQRGCDYVAFVNSDIQVMPSAIALVRTGDRDAYLFSRMDVDGETGAPLGVELAGVDAFVLRASWWMEHRHRFRSYIIGEPVWDNIYCAQILCHSRGLLSNRDAHIRHPRHATSWKASPFAEYTQYLSALDAPYFSLWCDYWTRLRRLRAGGAGEAEELAAQTEVFVWRPSLIDRFVHHSRMLKAHARYQMQQRREAT
jgi:hypothetical protein